MVDIVLHTYLVDSFYYLKVTKNSLLIILQQDVIALERDGWACCERSILAGKHVGGVRAKTHESTSGRVKYQSYAHFPS